MTIHTRLKPGRYKLRIEDYAVLGDAGVFGEARTELIDGEIIVMSPEWRPHMRIKDEIAYRLRRALEGIGSPYFVGTGGSIDVGEHEMPRPDILLTSDIGGEGAVPAKSIILVVEVSATTLDYDLGAKAETYARAGLPEYWVADVNARVLHHLWAPEGESYTERREIAFGAPICSASLDVEIATDGL